MVITMILREYFVGTSVQKIVVNRVLVVMEFEEVELFQATKKVNQGEMMVSWRFLGVGVGKMTL